MTRPDDERLLELVTTSSRDDGGLGAAPRCGERTTPRWLGSLLIAGLSVHVACGGQDSTVTSAIGDPPGPPAAAPTTPSPDDGAPSDALAAPGSTPGDSPGASATQVDSPPADTETHGATTPASRPTDDPSPANDPSIPAAGSDESPAISDPDGTEGPTPPVETPVDPGGVSEPEPPANVEPSPDPEPEPEPPTNVEPSPDPEPEPEPEPPTNVEQPEPWTSGLDERPAAAALSLPDTLDLAAPGWVAVEAFPALTFNTPTIFQAVPGTNEIYVAEMDGRIYAFDNDPAVAEKRLVLDISDHTQGLDCGLLGMAFHPDFGNPASPNGGYIYLQYPFKADPIVDQLPPGDTPTRLRLARFTVDLATLQIDPASELVLIDQDDQHIAHQGGPMFFHPDDGFLYYAVGDEGSHDCFLRNCQIIDKDLFSGVLRLDVDMRGGNISHPIPRQPATGVTANYYIPNDNPFVGQPGVLEEFYAIGLREPHRMTYDRIDNIAWIGDVGQARVEELNVLQRAANYQWAALEGSLPVFDPIPTSPLGIWTDPVLGLGRDEAGAIIGGYVYRGSKNPSLYGKYVFADYLSGFMWSLSYSYDGTHVTPGTRERLTTFRGITTFGVDQNNELYFLQVGPGTKIYTLGRTDGFTNVPTRLSQTGVFVDTTSAELEPSSGLIPYDVQSPLWSDGAAKQRWASIPDGETVAFSDNDNWLFPDGSVFVKHFELALDESRPEVKRRLETRLLVQGADAEFYGVTYKWNRDGTDADLVMESQVEPIDVALADGSTRKLKYFYPGPGDCAACHTDSAGSVLGLRTSQLNHDMLYPDTGRVSNQVFTWGQAGILDVAPDQASVEELVSLASPDDPDAPIEDRLRSYWAGNCSMCHRGQETDIGIRARWDARYETPLEDQGVVNGASVEDASDIVVPGDPASSIMFQRSSSTVPGYGMPPLGRSAIDVEYVALLSDWIRLISTGNGN